MDIDLLSRLISKVLREHDSVALPGLGSFESQLAPASFSDKGYTINPPYMKVVFRERVESDNYLVEAYSAEKGISEEDASRMVSGFLKALSIELARRSHISLPGLGKLKSIKDGGIIFVANEDADIYPDGFGLEPVSLKSRMVDDSEPIEFFPSEADLYPIVERPAAESPAEIEHAEEEENAEPAVAAEEEPAATAAAAVEEPVAAAAVEEPVAVAEEKPAFVAAEEPAAVRRHHHRRRKRSKIKTILLILVWIVVIAGLAFATFMLLCDFAPDFIDSLLYTKEELEIINA